MYSFVYVDVDAV